MANLSDLDMSNVQAESVRQALPAGDYQAVIVDSGMKVPKSGGAAMLELVLQVQGHPQFNGAKLWDRLNIRHAKPDVANIAKQRLKAIMDAVGLASVSDSQQLHNRQLTVTVAQSEYNGKPTNEVKGYSPKRSSGQPMTQTSYAASAANNPANPWG
jgi:hypothetical protein